MIYKIPFLTISVAIMLLQLSLDTNKAVAQKTGSAEWIYKKVSPAVIKVYSFTKSGVELGQASGVIIDTKGIVVTNLHILHFDNTMVEKLIIKHDTAVYTYQGIISWDSKNDLLFLKISGDNLTKIKMGNSNNIPIGQKVYAIGSPAGFENTISEGMISGKRNDNNQERLQLSAPVSPGSSGGAVVNDKGELVGISNMIIANTQNINFAIPAERVKQMLAKIDLNEPVSKANIFIAAGDVFMEKNNLTVAARYYEKGKMADNKSAAAAILAKTCFRLGDYTKAKSNALQSIKNNPGILSAYSTAGEVFLLNNQVDSAKKYAAYVLQKDSCNTDALLLNAKIHMALLNTKDGINQANKAIECGDKSAEPLMLLSYLSLIEKDYKAGVDYLEKAVKTGDDNYLTWLKLAQSYYGFGLYKEAAEAAEGAAKRNPDALEPYTLMALSQIALKNYSKAKIAALHIIQLSPDNTVGYALASTAEFKSHQLRPCIYYTKKYLEIDSLYKPMYERLAIAYMRLNMKDSADFYDAKSRTLKDETNEEHTSRLLQLEQKQSYGGVVIKDGGKVINQNSYIGNKDTTGKTCGVKIDGGTFSNAPQLVVFQNNPILIFEGWDNNKLKRFDMVMFDSNGKKQAVIQNGQITEGDKDRYQITITESECIVTYTSTQVITFHAIKRTDPKVGCVADIWLNMNLPNGFNFQATPDSSNANSYKSGTRIFGGMNFCFGFE